MRNGILWRTRSYGSLGVLVLGGWLGVVGSVVGQEAQETKPAAPSKAELAARGRVTFRVYCSNCHGVAGKGDGNLAKLLRTPPKDLSGLAARNKGAYAADEVRAQIDGRQKVAAHGQSDMPVWGLSFQNLENPADQEADVQAKLDQLVAFIETLQVAAPAKKK
jgi:mono/diheme cytochrome c family protein